MNVPYTKTWLSVSGQLAKLESRGLVVQDRAAASDFLGHLNYYCFVGYGLAFEQTRHSYRSGTTFEQVRQAYEFDRTLRDLFTESIELIELDLRTATAYSFAEMHQPFGHTDPANFFHKNRHSDWLDNLRKESMRATDIFVKHHKATYQEFPDLPLWVATEIMSFGSLSKMIQCMGKNDQKRIADRYGLQPYTLVSFVHHLVYIRNLCAHHARLWDRVWAIAPKLPKGKMWNPPLLPQNNRLFASLLVQVAFLRNIRAEKTFVRDWKKRMQDLISMRLPACPDPLRKMGVPVEWLEHPPWKQIG